MTGGYSLIDCFDVNITSDPVKIEGIFKKYQMSKRKAFLLSNVTINNTQLNDVFSTPYFEDGKVCFPAYDGVIKISDTDYVTFEATADVIADMYLSKEDFLTIESDNTPYVSRTARDGLVKIPNLVGATVAWNQLVENGNFADTSGWEINRATFSVSSNTAVFSNLTAFNPFARRPISAMANHKLMITATMKSTVNGNITLQVRKDWTLDAFKSFNIDNTFKTYSAVIVPTQNVNYVLLEANMPNYTSSDTISFKNFMLIDLTQMFGTTIAEYVYSLEQTTEGSGIAWLKSYGFFTKDYYAYDAGSLQSVCTSARKITALDGTVRTYPIDNEELRGLFKLDANNKLYADGDIYSSNGNGTRKYGIVDLGSLNWRKYADTQNVFFQTSGQTIDKKYGRNNFITSKYKTSNLSIATMDDKCAIGATATPYVYIKDSAFAEAWTNNTPEVFKSAMSGVYLVYELAEETTFSADPYINPQRSEGTEEFVDGLTRDVMIPVGNNSTYYKDELFNIIGEYIDSCDDAVIAMIPEGE